MTDFIGKFAYIKYFLYLCTCFLIQVIKVTKGMFVS